ncbi:hypothetical protein BDY24DRAFT_262033 [Mrakia frigida]|uniref:uncharacterized protein n=1 Tax=Mrakia frigida TaxID=29902 RepID=UPI003FCC259E
MASSPSEASARAKEEGEALSDEDEDSKGVVARSVLKDEAKKDPGPQRLPDDVIAWMIAFCSTRTLASLCLVNWRFLELASRVLYGSLTFRRHGSFDSVFCHRVSTSFSLWFHEEVSPEQEGLCWGG